MLRKTRGEGVFPHVSARIVLIPGAQCCGIPSRFRTAPLNKDDRKASQLHKTWPRDDSILCLPITAVWRGITLPATINARTTKNRWECVGTEIGDYWINVLVIHPASIIIAASVIIVYTLIGFPQLYKSLNFPTLTPNSDSNRRLSIYDTRVFSYHFGLFWPSLEKNFCLQTQLRS